MSYLDALHKARQARLRRMRAAGEHPKSGRQSAASRPQPAVERQAEDARMIALQEGRTLGEDPTIFEIKALVANAFGVSAVDLERGSRKHKYLLPRMVAMHLARRLTRWSLADIGLRFGGRRHSTALNASQRVGVRRKRDRAFSAQISAIQRQLRRRGKKR